MTDTILKVIQMILAAEPAVVTAVHNLMNGTGTIDDLAVLKADGLAWQSVADKAAVELGKLKPPSGATGSPTL